MLRVLASGAEAQFLEARTSLRRQECLPHGLARRPASAQFIEMRAALLSQEWLTHAWSLQAGIG
jgi:hypothetical protein